MPDERWGITLRRMGDSLRTVLAAALAALAADAPAGDAFRLTIDAGKFDERCMKIESGRAIAYRFEASAPVEFNIHHHRGKHVLYPVKREATRRFASTFRAESTDEYCLMWDNRGPFAVTVDGRVERR